MAKPPVNEMRDRFERLTERRSVAAVRAVYQQHQAALIRDIGASIGKRGGSEITGRDRAVFANHLRAAQRETTQSIIAELTTAQAEAHRDSLTGMARLVTRHEKRATSLDDCTRFEGVLHQRRAQMFADVHQRVSHNIEDATHTMHANLVRAVGRGTPLRQAVADLEQSHADQLWRFERLARTEAAFAYNAAQNDGIRALRQEFPDMHSRWVEHVDDATWKPMDNRVAADSMALHGQIENAIGLFVMPHDPFVNSDLWDRTWNFPPNRPNDRAIIMPWRKDWGIPAWKFVNGRRVWIVPRGRTR